MSQDLQMYGISGLKAHGVEVLHRLAESLGLPPLDTLLHEQRMLLMYRLEPKEKAIGSAGSSNPPTQRVNPAQGSSGKSRD